MYFGFTLVELLVVIA
ncbi:MAG: prepilin-type N-terminal cleavage/methylation domain-containing protein, partial [Planctomycetaceae bacterium]|nr:prepilin-type N-terminal cleavage/methylation domain-containing protein [Planctomycetaceae bacterium]